MLKIWEFLKYLFLRKDEHGIHSPFAYNLYLNVIKKRSAEEIFQKIEDKRKSLLVSPESIKVTDLGKDTLNGALYERRVSTIAANSLLPKKYAQMQYRLISFLKPTNIIELGTSLGITSLYLAYGNPSGCVYTFEGCPEIAQASSNMFDQFGLTNINVTVGDFGSSFNDKLKEIDTIDYIFIDGNHKFKPTIDYFLTALKHSSDETVFIFDDIYWSTEMMRAWKEIKYHKQVTLTIDLYRLGIVFISKKLSRENFILKY